jgi:dihydroorotate dehydrogenase
LIWQLAAAAARLLPPETAHKAAVAALQYSIGPTPDLPQRPVTLAGLQFANPLGLAAGFDKNAVCAPGAMRLGFGHVEVGTITPNPQPGNPRPRVFRLTEDRAVINRYGFNSDGMTAIARNLQGMVRPPGILGINVGANKTSENPTEDYRRAVAMLAGHADYITLNISSPNTPGLRDLQTDENLQALIRAGRAGLEDAGCQRPIFVKLAPDLEAEDIEAICARARAEAIDGLIATNTTIARPNDLRSAHRGEQGGLSGAPLFTRSTEMLALMRRCLDAGGPALIGAGGVSSGAEAYAKILAGASLVQLYTALALQGPDLPARVIRELDALMRADGAASVAAASGQLTAPGAAIAHVLRLVKTA